MFLYVAALDLFKYNYLFLSCNTAVLTLRVGLGTKTTSLLRVSFKTPGSVTTNTAGNVPRSHLKKTVVSLL